MNWNSLKVTWFPKQKSRNEIQSVAIRLRDSGKGSRRQWERLCGIIAFVAQVNRRAKHYSHLTSCLSLFDHDLNRNKVIKFHPLLIKGLDTWARVDTWMASEHFALPTILPMLDRCVQTRLGDPRAPVSGEAIPNSLARQPDCHSP